jgi:formylglycine-generating enzyme required for sulfatase activity
LQKFYWNPPVLSDSGGMEKEGADRSKEVLSFRGIWYPELLTDPFQLQLPIWAEEAGRDQYGIYADTLIAGIPQRFRWIEPTSFLMGSPESEPGRYDRETQHEVILTQGYWLADTACIQALWEAVMRKNPSGFIGKNKPVENISWDDIQKFLEQVNKPHPQLKLRLPTEAEWENGCRAGTPGAFNFEGELSLPKANYRGHWDDYEKWGEGALQQTAEVKVYPPNHWGLYQMHGNVWEWCRDCSGKYAKDAVADPLGPESGDDRVLRGGSWIYYGRFCRSACRLYYNSSYRDGNVGFRLARGHELQPVRSVRSVQRVK